MKKSRQKKQKYRSVFYYIFESFAMQISQQFGCQGACQCPFYTESTSVFVESPFAHSSLKGIPNPKNDVSWAPLLAPKSTSVPPPTVIKILEISIAIFYHILATIIAATSGRRHRAETSGTVVKPLLFVKSVKNIGRERIFHNC